MTAITNDTRFVAALLVTDTLVYEIVKRTPQTLTLRRTKDGAHRERDTLVDGGTDPDAPPVIWTEQVPDPDGRTQLVRLRKDGTFRLYGNPLRRCTEINGMPVRRTDYRF